MKWSFDARIGRAEHLANKHSSARELLNFYRELAVFQKNVATNVHANAITDVRALIGHFPALLDVIHRVGPKPVAEFACAHLQDEAAQERLLLEFWERGSSEAVPDTARFIAYVLLQPFAECLASRGDVRRDRAEPACPFCNSRPVVAVLRGEGEGGKRSLLCSLCATEWQYRRVLCPRCGEEDKDRLPIFIAREFDYIRVDACDSCQTYIKSVDLTKNGHAVPVVDEIASVALNLWAEEHGYAKLEPNLLGM